MAGEKKNQHYVPKCYLENWEIPNKKKKNKNKKDREIQVCAYNKIEQEVKAPINIRNIASENYYYDIEFSKVLSEENKQRFLSQGIDVDKLDNEHYIENYLSESVEDEFNRIIKGRISRLGSMNAWEIKNCYGFTEQEKALFSFHLSILTTRVNAVRNSLVETSELINKLLSENGASKETIDKYSLKNEDLPFVQGRMLLNNERLHEIATAYYSLTWVLLVNKTDHPLFTSDNPISRIAHIQNDLYPMVGIMSRGIEIYFPLSPDLLLLMYDGEYHKYSAGKDRSIGVIESDDIIRYYNEGTVLQSERWVVSNTNDFSLIDKMIADNPDAINDRPSIVTT